MRFLAGVLVGVALTPLAARARPPVPPDVFKAVRAEWHTKAERVKAFDIISCETGGRYNTTAKNGQYENIWQMGFAERRRFGWHVAGDSARKASRSARAYYDYELSIGRWPWSPWSCA